MAVGEEHPSRKEIQVQRLRRGNVSDKVHQQKIKNNEKNYCSQTRKNKTREDQTDTEAHNMHILAFWGVTVENLSFTLRQADTGGVTGQDLHFNRITVTVVL